MGGGQSGPEIRGDANAPHYVLMEYCGGWGYYKYADAAASRMEAKYPGKFRFELKKDPGVSGRLEVTIFFNSKEAQDKVGVTVHSKSKGDGYCHQNWTAFEQRVDDALKTIQW